MAQAFGIVHVLLSRETTKYRLQEKPDKRMTAIPARARFGEHLVGHPGQFEHLVELAIGQQSGADDRRSRSPQRCQTITARPVHAGTSRRVSGPI
jgi:hypothetical protein